ncbi:uncharacterized protein PV06_06367 [Exophiala oligosperma]|uniref:Heterokaryon incompatibility domain-containing protein n=1 Tax=Exophiala oligosperma TaxID=215243 RepID=A0A0D2E4Y2_9EURO|nr:uncharacterized protein PV06_06367 [Exophiala oligosperma]KIW42859.1 hypothetical protein PV06_06367 [Exophiala oligosperma]
MAEKFKVGENYALIGTYEYDMLDEDQIRLLRLFPETSHGGTKSPLQGELQTYRLTIPVIEAAKQENDVDNGWGLEDAKVIDEAPEYDALSYTWENVSYRNEDEVEDSLEKKTKTTEVINIVENEQSKGTIVIGPNLASALRRFRKEIDPEYPLWLWIDSICITQNSPRHNTEKSGQIQKMADIYQEATKVRVWLGEEDEDSNKACNFIKEILSFRKFNELCRSAEFATKWNAFRNLMQRPWFKRRWIVQEVAFAQQAEVYCGRDKLSWDELASAMSLFATKGHELRKIFQKSEKYCYNADHLGEIDAYGAKTLVDTIESMFRKSEDGYIMENLLSLEAVLTNLAAFDAQRPHDYIYAVMRLSNDAIPVSELSARSPVCSPKLPTEGFARHLGKQSGQLSKTPFSSDGHYHHSPERINHSPAVPTVNIPHTPDMNPNWDDLRGDHSRGRPRSRTPPHAKLLGVEPHRRTRSRSREPSRAAARKDAERGFRIPPKNFVVNYERSLFSLCVEVMNFIVSRTKSIDMICKPWVPNLSGDQSFFSAIHEIHEHDTVTMPSWIASLDKRAFSWNPTDNGYSYSRIAADPLVGTQLNGMKPYSASGIVPVPNEYLPCAGSSKLVDGRILKAHGFVLDTIDKHGSPAHNAVIPSKWLEIVDWKEAKRPSPEMSAPPEAFWRTLVANRASSDSPKPPEGHWRFATRWIFTRRPKDGNLDTGALLRDISGNVATPIVPFLHRLRAVIWNRSLIKTKGPDPQSLGFLGLAPPDSEAGDIVCILEGCSVPVVLRRKTRTPHASLPKVSKRGGRTRGSLPPGGGGIKPNMQNTSATMASQDVGGGGLHGSQDSETQREQIEYSFIGECYIHGMMDGEAFDVQKRFKLASKEFRIGCVATECNCDKCDPTKSRKSS